MRGVLRWLKFCAWTLLSSLVLLEVVMQIGALALHWLQPGPAPAPATMTPDRARTVLCVGDSWTQGMGSSDYTKFGYPPVLAELLRQRTQQEWVVVNGGLAGQNSRDVLQRLRSQLDAQPPSVLLVLVGRNDEWSSPPEFTDADDHRAHDAYRFRWRLPRLFAWIVEQFSTPVMEGPRTGPGWEPKPVPWFLGHGEVPRSWRETASSRTAKAEGFRLLHAGQHAEAAAQLAMAVRERGDDPETRGALVRCLYQLKRTDELTEHVDWLARCWATTRDYWVGHNLVHSYGAQMRHENVIAAAKDVLASFPDDETVRATQAQAEYFVGRFADAKATIDRAVRRYAAQWAFEVRQMTCLALRDVDEAIRSVCAGYVANNDAHWASGAIGRLLDDPNTTVDRLRATTAAFPMPDGVRARFDELVENGIRAADGSRARRVLAKHLGRIVSMARARGAQPVFLTYPIETEFAEVLPATAASEGVPFIDVQAAFRRKTAGRSRASLLAPCGHVNDDGYRIMAECIADELLPLLANPR